MIPGVDFVGKTGTAQVMQISADKIYQHCENMKFNERHNGVFVGFAPLNNPMIAVAVIGEHICHGTNAAPIARAVIKTYLEKYYPDLYGPKAIAERLKAQGGENLKPVFTATPAAAPGRNDEEDIQPENNERLPKNAAKPPIPPTLPSDSEDISAPDLKSDD
jgi:penicillin-binding protein 2